MRLLLETGLVRVATRRATAATSIVSLTPSVSFRRLGGDQRASSLSICSST